MLFFLLITITIISACDDPSPIGADFVGSEPLAITYYDTISIKMSTVKYDSIITSASSRLLVGQGMDQYLGEIVAQSFFQVGRDSLTTYPDSEKATYDSIALELVFDQYYYYDTTQYQSYSLYALVEEMELHDDGNLYNTSSVSLSTDSVFLLGQLTFLPKVNKGDPVYLHVSDAFGERLFELLINQDEIVTSTDNFLEYIRGLALIPDSTNTCIIGLSNETNLKLFYTQEGAQVEQMFPVADNIHFSKILYENHIESLDRLSVFQDILPSEDTDNTAFVQGGIGLGVRIEFPYLEYIREMSRNILVSDAELVLSPVRNSYSGFEPLLSELNAYIIDKRNNILSEIDIDATLYYDDEYNEDTYYVISIQGFLDYQLNLLEDNDQAILISLPNNSVSVNRLCLGNGKHENRSFLRLLIMNTTNTF